MKWLKYGVGAPIQKSRYLSPLFILVQRLSRLEFKMMQVLIKIPRYQEINIWYEKRCWLKNKTTWLLRRFSNSKKVVSVDDKCVWCRQTGVMQQLKRWKIGPKFSLSRQFQRHYIFSTNKNSIMPYRTWQSRIFIYFAS